MHHAAITDVAEHAQAVAGAEILIVDCAALGLMDALARVKQGSGRGNLGRVGVELRMGQAERVLRARQRHRVRKQGQLAAATDLERQFRIAGLALRRAMVAIAVGLKMGDVEVVTKRPGYTARVRAGAKRAIARAGEADVDLRRIGAIGAEDLDYAAGRVAVQRRKRPAQHFDAIGRVEIEMRNLALTVRHRRRNAIGVQAHAAHAERGTRAEAADRDLLVLRIVLSIAREYARNR